MSARPKSFSRISFLVLLVVPFLLPPRGAAQEKAEKGRAKGREGSSPQALSFQVPLRVFWKEGLRFESVDKSFRLHLGGRIHWDSAWMSEESSLKRGGFDLEDGSEFRRARLQAAGTIYRNVVYKAVYDFAGGETKTKRLFIGMKGIPYAGTFLAGYLKEPFGLEERTSSNYLTFIERSLPEEALTPDKNVGFLVRNTAWRGRLTWGAGIFRESDGLHRTKGEAKYNLTGRFGGLPWKEGEDHYIFLGLAGSLRDPARDPDRGGGKDLRYRAHPEGHLAPYLANTGYLDDADSARLLSLESAGVWGPFSLQAETIHSWVDSRAGGDPHFWGAYAQASWFLTGEHRPFRPGKCVMGRVRPEIPFSPKGGSGAWEAALRWSRLDLESGHVKGGVLQDWTVGLNWYLNPNTRLMWNYVFARLAGGDRPNGWAQLFLMRFQVDF